MKFFGPFILIYFCLNLLGCGASGGGGVGPSPNGIDPEVGEMVLVGSGEFTMGSQWGILGFGTDESPEHRVWLHAYYISSTEVTNSEYASFLSDSSTDRNHFNPEMEIFGQGAGFIARPGSEDYPVQWATWYNAQAYAEWLGGRLPTEAEWEKAARGPVDRRIFPWGNHISPGNANWDNSLSGLWEVGIANGRSYYGLFDMGGNAWEWTWDWYEKIYYNAPPYENPTGPVTGQYKSIRGGGYQSTNEYDLRCSKRFYVAPDGSFLDVGFRCVIDSVDYDGGE